MPVIHLPNGVGENLGDYLATAKPLEVTSNVWYVSSVSGTDAVSPAGQNHSAPLATLGQAVTNAANGDIIVLLADHNQIVAATITISKDLTIIGAGLSGALPTAKLTNNQAAATMLNITATGFVQLRNIWFEEESQANSQVRISISSTTGTQIISGCYFQAGQYDDDFVIEVANSGMLLIRNTTFISTPTVAANRPYSAIGSAAAGTTWRNLMLDGVVIDGGIVGWSRYHAIDIGGAIYPANIAIESLSLLNGSDIRIHSSTVGYINVATPTAGCRVDWDGVV